MSQIFFINKNAFLFILLIIIQINITFLLPFNFNPEGKIHSKSYHSFCGVDYIETDAFNKPPDTNIKTKKFNPKLTSGVFNPVRRFLDTTFLDYQVKSRKYGKNFKVDKEQTVRQCQFSAHRQWRTTH